MVKKVLILNQHLDEVTKIKEYLDNKYSLVFVISGEELMKELQENAEKFSAIIIDIKEPKYELYELLKTIHEHDVFSQIPVIATLADGDKQALKSCIIAGALGYLFKPITMELLISSLANLISLKEKTILNNPLRIDELTHLPKKSAFFERADILISQHEPGYYTLSCFDIENFKVINDQYGFHIGDQVLKHIGKELLKGAKDLGGICFRHSADKFGVLYPTAMRDSEIAKKLYFDLISNNDTKRNLKIRVGRYTIDDLSIPVNIMYDRATLAEESIKGRYNSNFIDYTNDMRNALINEQKVVNAMNDALVNKEFEPWFQPQYNHATGALIGAEALVRWKRNGTYVLPSDFVPVFERNGFIYEMDQYIWESVCILLRKWLDKGSNPIPISVNISRRDLFHRHFLEVLLNIVNKYEIPYELLRLEVTESAFAEASGEIIKKVGQLIELGFVVEIDDFGSGYSSLNTLKDVPAQILKLDMRFFENNGNQIRGGNIIESVIRMAKWLDMSVIAEGVEDKSQADFLKSIGCYYIQGYYYSKPVCLNDYEALVTKSRKEVKLNKLTTIQNLNNNEFWNPKSMETLIFNSYVGGACIFEYSESKLELIRVNDRFIKELNGLLPEDMTVKNIDFTRLIDYDNALIFTNNIKNCIKTNSESTANLFLRDESIEPVHIEYLRLTVRSIAKTDSRYLFYCVIVNETEKHLAEEKRIEAEKKQLESSNTLKVIMDNINGGVSAIKISDNGTSKLIFNNDRYFEVYGYTKKEAIETNLDVMKLILPQDLPYVMLKIKKLKKDGIPTMIDYRCRKKNGSIAYIRVNSSLMNIDGEEVIASIVTDVTELREAEIRNRAIEEQLKAVLNNVTNGVTAVSLREQNVNFIFANDRYFQIFGLDRSEYNLDCIYKAISKINEENKSDVRKFIRSINDSNPSSSIIFNVKRPNKHMATIKCTITLTRFINVIDPVQVAVFQDITTEKETIEQQSLINDIFQAILVQADTNEATKQALNLINKYFIGDRTYIYEIDHKNKLVSKTYEVSMPGILNQKENFQNVPIARYEKWIEALVAHKILLVDNVNASKIENETKKLLLKDEISSMISAPLYSGTTLVGFVGVDNPKASIEVINGFSAISDCLSILLLKRNKDKLIQNSISNTKQLINDIPGGFCRLGVTANNNEDIIYINEGLCKLLDMSYEYLMANYEHKAYSLVYGPDLEKNLNNYYQNRGQENCFSFKCRLIKKNGDMIWVFLFGRFTTDENNQSILNIYINDLTSQIETEKYQNELLDNLPCGAALYKFKDGNLSIIHINNSYWQLVERKPVPNTKLDDFIHPDDLHLIYEEIGSAIRNNRSIAVDFRVLKGSGDYIPFHTTAKIRKGSDNSYLLFATYTPISDSTMSISELLPIAMSTMLETSNDFSYIKDLSLEYICASKTLAKFLGAESVRDIIGKKDKDYFDSKIVERFSKNDLDIITSKKSVTNATELVITKTGNVIRVVTSKYPIIDPNGQVIGIYGISRDITEESKKEIQYDLLNSTIIGGITSFMITPNKIQNLFVNDGFYKYSGYTQEEYEAICKHDPLGLIYKEDREIIESIRLNAERDSKDGAIHEFTYRSITKSGDIKWLQLKYITRKTIDDCYIVNALQFDITEQKKNQEELRLSEEEYKIATLHIDLVICRYDVVTKRLTFNHEAAEKLGIPFVIENVPASSLLNNRISSDTIEAYQKFYDDIASGKMTGSAVFNRLLPTGWRWIGANFTTIFTNNKPVSAVISYQDITLEQEKELVYKKWQQALRVRKNETYYLMRWNLSKDKPSGKIEGNLLKMDIDLFGSFNELVYDFAKHNVVDKDLNTFINNLDCSILLANFLRGKRTYSFSFRSKIYNGKVHWINASIDLVEYPNSNDAEAYIMFEDIDKLKREEFIAKEMMQKDPLTGLLNRKAFSEKMKDLIQEKCGLSAVLLLDIDNFKLVNDTYGHIEGDSLLIEVGRKITEAIKENDLACRLGGDEFIMFVTHISGVEEANDIARSICDSVREKIGSIKMSVSIGISLYPDNGKTFSDLYQYADIALYNIKKTTKNSYKLYDHSMDNFLSEMVDKKLTNDLTKVILYVGDNDEDFSVIMNCVNDLSPVEYIKSSEELLSTLDTRAKKYDIIILDSSIENNKGLSILAELKVKYSDLSLHVIVINDSKARDKQLKAFKYGAFDYLPKPIDPALLRLRIDAAAKKNK